MDFGLEVDLTIGGEDVDENYMFRRVSDIEVVNSSGEIVHIIEKDEKRQPTSRKEENEYLEKRIERSRGGGGIQGRILSL